MATVNTHRPLSQYFSSTPSTPAPNRHNPRRTGGSHYRPISQLLSEETGNNSSPTSSRKRPAIPHRRISVLFQSNTNAELPQKVKKSHPPRAPSDASVRSSSKPSSEKRRISILAPNPWKKSLDTIYDSIVIDVSKKNVLEDDVTCNAPDEYVKKNIWYRRGVTKLHPYRGDAVYMQSYDPIVLENERYSYQLLRRLTSSVPTFSTSMEHPPSNVLDLGCGQGHWLLDASNVWPATEFVGFDLVDVLAAEVREKANVTLVRGNFVKYPLPFADRSFDFIRMANLSLAIPHDKWDFVLSEVHRVLKVDGQFELIDDELRFPYASPPATTHSMDGPAMFHQRSSQLKTSQACNNRSDSESSCSSPTFWDSDTADSDLTSIEEDIPTEPKPSTFIKSPMSPEAYAQQWKWGRQISRDVEFAFENMLWDLQIHPYPREFVPDLLKYIFGGASVSQGRTFNIQLASPPPTSIRSDSQRDVNSSELDRKAPIEEKRAVTPDVDDANTAIRSMHPSAKAAGRLGISYSDLLAATAVAKRTSDYPGSSYTPLGVSQGHPSESLGIIIAPSTFIPLSPMELEFHACKWIHTVLGCKPAMFDYVRSFFEDDGRRAVQDWEFHEAMWDYECFRRQRFHWPSDPEDDPESFITPYISRAPQMSLSQSKRTGHKSLVDLRTIRVYHAIKTDMTSLASLLFPPTSPTKFHSHRP